MVVVVTIVGVADEDIFRIDSNARLKYNVINNINDCDHFPKSIHLGSPENYFIFLTNGILFDLKKLPFGILLNQTTKFGR